MGIYVYTAMKQSIKAEVEGLGVLPECDGAVVEVFKMKFVGKVQDFDEMSWYRDEDRKRVQKNRRNQKRRIEAWGDERPQFVVIGDKFEVGADVYINMHKRIEWVDCNENAFQRYGTLTKKDGKWVITF